MGSLDDLIKDLKNLPNKIMEDIKNDVENEVKKIARKYPNKSSGQYPNIKVKKTSTGYSFEIDNIESKEQKENIERELQRLSK